MTRDNLISSRWDDEYRRGRYATDAAVPFVETIITTLQQHDLLPKGMGLYVGCGNGRNYLPLVDAKANVVGLDVSGEAIRRLGERRPELKRSLVSEDFRAFQADAQFNYLIAIQVFQHGTEDDVAVYFERVAAMLKVGGLFFLRVNSAATEIYHAHTVVERNAFGGFTIRYDEGPKRGLSIHFYSSAELLERLKNDFEILAGLRHDVVQRTLPKTGSWAQWEVICQRRVIASDASPLAGA